MPPLFSLGQAPVMSKLKRRKIAELSKRPSKKTKIESLLVMDSTDIELVRGGKLLTDCHIDIANKFLKRQFPEERGLQSPLLGQSLIYGVTEPPFVQVMHVSGNHWVTVVAITNSLVKVYDSLYKRTNTCVTSQSAAILKSESDHIVFQSEKVQTLEGTTDCGLFAIAFATEYCHGNNPECFR